MQKKNAASKSDAQRLGRRAFLTSAGALAGTAALSQPAAADGSMLPSRRMRGATSPPRPIPGGTDLSGLGLVPPYDFIHWYPTGPSGQVLPHSQLPLGGLDCEPSTITDFYGSVALGYIIGEAKGSDGSTSALEADIRLMKGWYRGLDGEIHFGAFCLI